MGKIKFDEKGIRKENKKSLKRLEGKRLIIKEK